MITDPILKYWGHGTLSVAVRGGGLPVLRLPDHGSKIRLGIQAHDRSAMAGLRISLTLSHEAP